MSQIPIVDYLVLEQPPRLRAQVCTVCEASYFDRRNGCARCGGRAFLSEDLPRDGTVVSFTIVHRAAPGLDVPYVSVIVELDGGRRVKANLVGVAPEAAEIMANLRVRLTTWTVGKDDNGTEAVTFGFEPSGVKA